MKILAIVRVNLVRASRDRTALFFSVLLPLILILVLGLTFGSGSSARIGLVDADGGPIAARLVAGLGASSDLKVEVRRYDSIDALRDAASRGIVQVGVAIPAGYSSAPQSGGQTSVTLVVPPTAVASAIRTMAELAIASQASLVRAARFAGATNGRSFEASLEAASALAATLPGVATTIVPINAAATSTSGYDAGAQGQLILFMFLTSLTGAAELVITRQLGISRRMFSTPTGLWTIIVGESMARIAFALVQGLFIVAASAILFGVRWETRSRSARSSSRSASSRAAPRCSSVRLPRTRARRGRSARRWRCSSGCSAGRWSPRRCSLTRCGSCRI